MRRLHHQPGFWSLLPESMHQVTMQGIQCLTDEETDAIVARDRESHQRDLFHSIESGDFPKCRVMPEKYAEEVPSHPFDLTKVWPH